MQLPSSRSERVALGVLLLVCAAVLLIFVRGGVDDRSEDLATAPLPRAEPVQQPTTTPRRRVRHPELEVAPAPLPPVDVAASEPPKILRYRVRDIWNGADVPGLAFALAADLDVATRESAAIRAQTATGEWILAPDADGQIPLPAAHLAADIRPLDPAWHVADREEAAAEATPDDDLPTLWVYSMLEVSGTVRSAVPKPRLRLSDVEISARAHGADSVLDPSGGAAGQLLERWLAQRGLRPLGTLGNPTADGRFQFEIPRVRGTTIRARVPDVPDVPGKPASGWQDATFTIPEDVAATGHARMDFLLERGYEVTGRLVDEDGRPLAGVRVDVHVVIYVDKEELIISELRKRGHGYGARWHPGMPKAIVDYRIIGTTDADGRFRIVSKIDGKLIVSVIPDTEHHVEVVPGGQVSTFDRSDPFTLRSSRGRAPVKLAGRHGRSFAGLRVSCNDMSLVDIQPTYSFTLGDDSMFPSRFLVEGHEYSFSVWPKSGALPIADEILLWSGEPELEIGPLTLGGKRATSQGNK